MSEGPLLTRSFKQKAYLTHDLGIVLIEVEFTGDDLAAFSKIFENKIQAGKMAEWEKHLPYKHYGRTLDSQYPLQCQMDVVSHP